jgi:hypothetical protein
VLKHSAGMSFSLVRFFWTSKRNELKKIFLFLTFGSTVFVKKNGGSKRK